MLSVIEIIADITRLAGAKQVWLAYSGGVDSHVLLDIVAKHFPYKVHVVHVNHGLQADAKKWAAHCEQVVAGYELEYTALNVRVDNISELGLEAAARRARYQSIAKVMPTDAVLLTAQHQQDQAETLLLQLLRGAGSKGLAAMTETSNIYGLFVIRPLLASSQQDISVYAEQAQLNWVEDPSNQDTSLNRNYIRQTVWPLLETRWPSAAKTLSRSSRLCQQSNEILHEVAIQDLQKIEVAKGVIDVEALLQLTKARQQNCIRSYIESLGLMLPSETVLADILSNVCLAKIDAMPVVEWGNAIARRYQGKLYLELKQDYQTLPESITVSNIEDIRLSDSLVLSWQMVKGDGIKQEVIDAGIQLRFRKGGEKIQLRGKSHHESLKKLMQQWQVPPWQRASIPLLYRDDELVGIVGYAYAHNVSPTNNEIGFVPVLQLGA